MRARRTKSSPAWEYFAALSASNTISPQARHRHPDNPPTTMLMPECATVRDSFSKGARHSRFPQRVHGWDSISPLLNAITRLHHPSVPWAVRRTSISHFEHLPISHPTPEKGVSGVSQESMGGLGAQAGVASLPVFLTSETSPQSARYDRHTSCRPGAVRDPPPPRRDQIDCAAVAEAESVGCRNRHTRRSAIPRV